MGSFVSSDKNNKNIAVTKEDALKKSQEKIDKANLKYYNEKLKILKKCKKVNLKKKLIDSNESYVELYSVYFSNEYDKKMYNEVIKMYEDYLKENGFTGIIVFLDEETNYGPITATPFVSHAICARLFSSLIW